VSQPLDDWVAERDREVAERISRAQSAGRHHVRPLTDRHHAYVQAINEHPVVVSTGPAGTGKTSLACAVAARMLKEGAVKRVVITRPLVACDEDLGILPGTVLEKVNPYLAPVLGALNESLGAQEVAKLLATDVIEVCPLAVMRGRTFHDAFVICDEAENATYRQLHMLLLRQGYGSRFVVNGDVTQSDLPRAPVNPLERVALRLLGDPEVAVVRMTHADVLRPPLVERIDARLSLDD
jgi:phosphate starvation-inducible PhoH-like protein